MSHSHRIAKNFFFLSVAEVVSRILSTLLAVFVAQRLGAQIFGQFAFATAFVSFFNIFSDFGLTTLGIREIAKERGLTNKLATNIEVLQIGISLVLLVVLGCILFFLPLDFRSKLIVMLFGLNMLPMALNISFVFQAHERMAWVGISRVISQTSYVVLGFLLVIITRDIILLPLVLSVTSMIGVGIVYTAAKRFMSFRLAEVDWRTMKGLFIQALPFVWSALAIQVYYNLDSVMLGFIDGQKSVGLYNSAYKIVLFILTTGGILTGVVFPFLSHTYKHDRLLFDKTIHEWARLVGFLAWPVAIGGVLLARPILLLVFQRPEYGDATVAFQFLLLLPIIIFWNGLYGNPLVAVGYQKYNTYGVILGAGINILANLLLIPRYGINGAAIATVLAELSVLLYLAYFSGKLIRIKVASPFIFKPLLAAVCMGVFILLLRNSISIYGSLCLGGIVYFVILALLGGVSIKDFDYLRRIRTGSS